MCCQRSERSSICVVRGVDVVLILDDSSIRFMNSSDDSYIRFMNSSDDSYIRFMNSSDSKTSFVFHFIMALVTFFFHELPPLSMSSAGFR